MNVLVVETHMQEAIRKRGNELIGLLMVAASFLFGAILWSYTPEDPSWVNQLIAPCEAVCAAGTMRC